MELRNRQLSDEAAASSLSWNTFLSRTSVSSLSSAAFSNPNLSGQIHGLDDVLNTVKALSLPRFQYGEIERQDVVGEGETFIVERCVVRNQVLAMKHLKTNLSSDDSMFRRRLQSVILELRIMRHAPLRSHPNILAVFGYGWNTKATQIVPYLLVQYAPYGTLREYLRHFKFDIQLTHKEILLGDVAAATSTLHLCGIIHGDIKLDNVLVFHSWDRPTKSIAKIADFGHSLIISRKEDAEQAYIRYGGTFIYNAPEVHDQKSCPIDRAALHKCDIWAFGLLAWETFLDGEEYVKRIAELEPYYVEDGNEPVLAIPDRFLELAKKSLPFSKSNLRGRLIHSIFNMTIQTNPSKRISNLAKLPFMSQWNSAGVQGLEAELALHFGTSEWNYEMCSPENSREIPWEHEVQIYQGLQRTHNSSHNRNGDVAWQLALCQHVGFGSSPNPDSAYQFALAAERLNHPVAKLFAPLLAPNGPPEFYVNANSYTKRVVDLLQESNVVDVSREVDATNLLNRLETETDGCFTPLHFLFAFEDHPLEMELLARLRKEGRLPSLDEPTKTVRKAHAQWPLRLVGSPLVFAISVNSMTTVQNLLSLGANPYIRAFAPGQFPEGDQRSKWTAIHVAVQYHCYEILTKLLDTVPNIHYRNEVPYACALSYSSSLERIAMHGNNRRDLLAKTVSILQRIEPLSAPTSIGRTTLMQAIDFHDADVVLALLSAQHNIASILFRDPRNPANFNRPIHWAAQLGGRRDVPETLRIIEMVNDFSDDMNPHKRPPLDSAWRTPLHLAVTGPSTRTSTWIVERRPGLLDVEDKFGRTALHYCASPANVNLLLSKGADVNHTDKRGLTTLHGACLRGELDIVRCLLEKNPSLNLKNNPFGTPLHCAISRGSLDVAMVLVEAGAPVNELDQFDETPLHLASSLSRHNIIRLLLQHGVDISVEDSKGRTAATIAKSLGTVVGMVTDRILHGEDESLDDSYAKALYAQYMENGFDTKVIPVYQSREASSASNSMSRESDIAVGSVELIDYAGSFQAEVRHEESFDAEGDNVADTIGPERKLAEFVSYLHTDHRIPLVGARELVRLLTNLSEAAEQISLTELQHSLRIKQWESLRGSLFAPLEAKFMVSKLRHGFQVPAVEILKFEDAFYAQRADNGQRGPWYEMIDDRLDGRSPWYGLARSLATILELGRTVWQVLKLDDAKVNELVDVGKMFDLVAVDEATNNEGLFLPPPLSLLEDVDRKKEIRLNGDELYDEPLLFTPYHEQRASFKDRATPEGSSGIGISRREDDGRRESSDDTDDSDNDIDKLGDYDEDERSDTTREFYKLRRELDRSLKRLWRAEKRLKLDT
ncbi:hypothetical protein GGR53DRAFT_513939 [Hypoxylon sp. FL1150]|nr:hypothetical protein GGR53DRAFT_513939 [Hypoxylon sp. FL1150]